ncbi:MAG: hypothetical protein EBE86_035395 [Hormoscilla sp. GUM202]|nr:hypothetical protein [Hormoscilla sp. GUM202]
MRSPDCSRLLACHSRTAKPPSQNCTTTFYTSRILPVKRSPSKTRFYHCDRSVGRTPHRRLWQSRDRPSHEIALQLPSDLIMGIQPEKI